MGERGRGAVFKSSFSNNELGLEKSNFFGHLNFESEAELRCPLLRDPSHTFLNVEITFCTHTLTHLLPPDRFFRPRGAIDKLLENFI